VVLVDANSLLAFQIQSAELTMTVVTTAYHFGRFVGLANARLRIAVVKDADWMGRHSDGRSLDSARMLCIMCFLIEELLKQMVAESVRHSSRWRAMRRQRPSSFALDPYLVVSHLEQIKSSCICNTEVGHSRQVED
jgi:hypothetical protein